MPFSEVDASRPIEELTLPFDPTTAQERVQRRRRRMRARAVSLVITVAILAVLYFWQRDQLSGAGFYVLYGVFLGIPVVWLLAYVVLYVRAKRALARVETGIAVRIGRPGVEVRGRYVPWLEVRSLAAAKRGWGRSPVMRLTPSDGPPVEVPFDQLDVRPATLDLTARAYSAGRHGVDLEALES